MPNHQFYGRVVSIFSSVVDGISGTKVKPSPLWGVSVASGAGHVFASFSEDSKIAPNVRTDRDTLVHD